MAGFADYMVHTALTMEEIGFFIILFHWDTTGLQVDKHGLDPTFGNIQKLRVSPNGGQETKRKSGRNHLSASFVVFLRGQVFAKAHVNYTKRLTRTRTLIVYGLPRLEESSLVL